METFVGFQHGGESIQEKLFRALRDNKSRTNSRERHSVCSEGPQPASHKCFNPASVMPSPRSAKILSIVTMKPERERKKEREKERKKEGKKERRKERKKEGKKVREKRKKERRKERKCVCERESR